MKKILLAAGVLLFSANAVFAAKPKVSHDDQVLLTIDGTPVTVGEFEYLYHKNNEQQLVPQTIDEYLDMFINYKLKVAEAEAAGIDTTAAFRQEFDGYAHELAKPYIYDTETERQLVANVYDHMRENVEVSHIMLPLGQNADEKVHYGALMDSIRTVIVNGGDFAQLAHDYTYDSSTAEKGGYMGFIRANSYPYQFEDMAYETAVGAVSPVFTTNFGHHIIKVHSRRPASGYVTARHILKLTAGAPDDVKAMKKQQIDSIHALLLAGADFAEIATAESEDPGSARNGGLLPEFTTGMMVPSFEQAAFALADGEISSVVETPYGYHIIKREGHRGLESFEEAEPMIRSVIMRDERKSLPRKAKIQALREKYNVVMNRPAIAMVESVIRNNGGLNKTAMENLSSMPAPLATYDGGSILLNEVMSSLSPMGNISVASSTGLFLNRLNTMVDEVVLEKEIAELPQTNGDYRNLLNEYRDGMLLFEISDREVWTRAKEDTAGLNKWFDEHRDRYTWDKPKFRSYVIFATSDSVMNRINDYLAVNKVAGKNLEQVLKQLCGKNVRVERVIASQGENDIVDYLGFGGVKPLGTSKWPVFAAYESEMLERPMSVSDDRGAITADYQTSLEEKWVKDLRARHKVKIDKKVLKSLR
ncbi:MAG: peptidylprolyl isomerase [Muribaculaceae bacterium]|nr:peptidylprolyl isomerase [Muribaculaceae bacterium]